MKDERNKMDKRDKEMKRFQIFKVLILAVVIGSNSCGDFLDIVPEGVATIEMAFNSRTQALKYLATCYSYMPRHGDPGQDPGILGGDEMWTEPGGAYFANFGVEGYRIGLGEQNAVNVQLDFWGNLYQALRNCNIFLENVEKVPDLMEWERNQWIAEVKVLKAYYHFYLVQMYGPVPLVRENIPVSATVNDVKVVREPIDDCFEYIVELLDEAIANEYLPLWVYDPAEELGRITRPIAMALKAKVLVTAASPLFNGNTEQEFLLNRDNTQLFNPVPDPQKWQKAMIACAEAIEICHDARIELYKFPNTGLNPLTDTIATQMSLRNAFTVRWNSEIIWANTQYIVGSMQLATTPVLNPTWRDAAVTRKALGVTLKIANLFYTDKGVPLAEDNTRDFSKIYDLRVTRPEDKLYLRASSTTVDMHFDREPRFYAWVGFDCGIWYGQGRSDDREELWSVYGKFQEVDGKRPGGLGPYSSHYPKKYIHYNNVMTSLTAYSITSYSWPIIRLSDLYLLYAEAINEWEGSLGPNSSEMFKYINLVRERAGLRTVRNSWDNYTNNRKYENKEGMRQIIQQERMIELAFEGHRFWDMRRWKNAYDLYRTPMESFNTMAYMTNAYYTPIVLLNREFSIRDYFWPIRNSDITNNRNLVQNIGW